MQKSIEIVDVPEQATLEIHTTGTMMVLPMLIGKSFKKIVEYIESKGKVEHMPYVRYINVCWDVMNESKLTAFFKMFTRKWDMIIAIPVTNALDGNEEIVAGTLPGGRYVETMHIGPYQKVGDAYSRMNEFIRQEGLKIRNESIEIYLNDPRTVSKQELETRVLIPLEE